MKTYEVTATNIGFYQVLRVDAANEGAAAERFQSYLGGKENQDWELYEYNNWRAVSDDGDKYSRDDFEYQFDEERVSEAHGYPACPEVRVVESGGNG